MLHSAGVPARGAVASIGFASPCAVSRPRRGCQPSLRPGIPSGSVQWRRLPMGGRTAGCYRAGSPPGAVSRWEEPSELPWREVDADLWQALEFCDEDELEAIHGILFGPSPFSPVVKNIVVDDEPPAVRHRGRDGVMHRIESRFRFLAADSVATLQGYRPSYRDTLVHMRHRLRVECPSSLETPDLECEIFLHLLKHHAASVSGGRPSEDPETAAALVQGDGMGSIRPVRPRRRWLDRLTAPLRFGGREAMSMLTKLGGVVTLSAVRNAVLQDVGAQVVAKRLSYQAALKVLCSEGISNLRRQAAVQAAQRGLTTTAVRYGAMRSTLSMLGPIMWGWLAVDMALKSVGTDYSRIVKTVFALAQVRLLRTYGFTSPSPSPSVS